MYLTDTGVVTPLGVQPYETLLAGKLYNRSEKRLFPVADFRVSIVARSENRAELLLCSDSSGILVPVRLELEPDELKLTIEAGRIVESASDMWRLMELSAFPDLMASRETDDGAYLLPLFSGMRVPFRGQSPSRNRDRIFMERANWEKFGQCDAFGMFSGAADVLGIVGEGGFRAWVDSEFNLGGRNRLCATFALRHQPRDVIPQEIKQLHLLFLEPTGRVDRMAFAYRRHLVEKRGIVPLRERIGRNPVLDYAVHAMRVKIFLGQKRPFESDGSGTYVNCTTFYEAGEILQAMYDSGIRRAVITLVGWNLGGHDGAYPTRFPVNSEAGGETGLRTLIERVLELGYQIVPHDNVTDVYLASPDYDPELVMLDEGGERQPAGVWAGGLSYKICPTVVLNRFGGEFRRIHRLGFRGCYYLDAQAAGLFCCTHPAHPADERTFALSLARIALLPRELFGSVSTEFVPSYMLPFADEASCIPGRRQYERLKPQLPESLQALRGEVVPFYQIAVHGLLVHQAGWVHTYGETAGERRRGLLEELATGARPSMEVSMRPLCNGGNFRKSIDSILEFYRINFELCREIQTAFVRSWTSDGTRTVLEYDSGHRFELDHGDSPSLRIIRNGELISVPQ